MRKGFLLGGALCALLMASAPVQADISVFLDNPSTGPLSGNDLVNGWAFALVNGSPVDVTVTVRIDGVNQNEVLCCGARADVQAANPGAPLNTGFGSLIPYGELAAGPHTIGVEITSVGSVPVIIDRSVQVVKPGGASFIQSMDFSAATFAATGDGFDADGVGITSADGTVNDDLDVAFSSSSQALLITGPAPDVEYFFANLNGSQEQPIVDTQASGSGAFTLNTDNTLSYEVLTSGVVDPVEIMGSAAHIHMAEAGSSGGILFPLTLKASSTTDWQGTTVPLDADQLNALLNGNLYVNVHTAVNMGGEIRGQIVASDTCSVRSAFVGAPLEPAGRGANTEGCRELNDQASCDAAWQLDPDNRNAVSCLWNDTLDSCGACGPMRTDCTNACN